MPSNERQRRQVQRQERVRSRASGPQGLGVDRLLVLGTAPRKEDALPDAETPASRRVSLGGIALGRLGSAEGAHVLFDLPSGDTDAEAAADFALGAQLRAYKFDTYRTKRATTMPADCSQVDDRRRFSGRGEEGGCLPRRPGRRRQPRADSWSTSRRISFTPRNSRAAPPN